MGTVTVGMGCAGSSTTGTQYRYWRFVDCKWREGILSCQFVRDRTLTATGWDGAEGPGDGTGDWQNEYKEGPAS